ncbi:MAG TPA: flagellar basal body-associated FliL family protein, partial [Bacteroidetes bacterium]|nr:flagellar basal body-associated FliL family protein [Bacteroidota bacterium]
ELQAREPQIRDNLITFLSAQRVDVLTDITMRERIRKRILEIVNTRLTEGVVDNAYFIRYVFQ